MKNFLIISIFVFITINLSGQSQMIVGADLNIDKEIVTYGIRVGGVTNNNYGVYASFKYSFLDLVGDIEVDYKQNAILLGLIHKQDKIIINGGVGIAASDTKASANYENIIVEGIEQATRFVFEYGAHYRVTANWSAGVLYSNATRRAHISINHNF